eukprot:126560_1
MARSERVRELDEKTAEIKLGVEQKLTQIKAEGANAKEEKVLHERLDTELVHIRSQSITAEARHSSASQQNRGGVMPSGLYHAYDTDRSTVRLEILEQSVLLCTLDGSPPVVLRTRRSSGCSNSKLAGCQLMYISNCQEWTCVSGQAILCKCACE